MIGSAISLSRIVYTVVAPLALYAGQTLVDHYAEKAKKRIRRRRPVKRRKVRR